MSARRHLEFYGRLKGLNGKALRDATQKALADVNLADVQNRAAGGLKKFRHEFSFPC